MLSLRQLNKAVDSLQHNDTIYAPRFKREINPYLRFARYADTGWKSLPPLPAVTKEKLFTDSLGMSIADAAANQLSTIKGNILVLANDAREKQISLELHQIEWHRKFTLSMGCLVLFLIGAPLGSIIRKGGLGTPLVFATVFFVVFYLLNTVGEKVVKSGQLSAWSGMWLSTLVLIPVGIFLTAKAMRDSQLFNQEFYYRNFKVLRQFWTNFKEKKP
jgi:lipopolysaccharide export system permease protein